MASTKFLIVVGGATASGKTALAIALARHFQTAILSCDSRQFYRELQIGTASPTPEELAQAPHHFVGHLSISEPYSVGAFEQDALQLLERLYQQHQVVILAGGSGLYQKALCEGLDSFPEVPVAVRQQIEQRLEKEGIKALQEELKQQDPDYYQEVDLQNPHRLIRALSVIEVSGQPFSSFRKKQRVVRPFIPIYLWLHWDRALLYERINQRVDLMVQSGLLAEAKTVLPYRAHTALQTVGYQELFDYFDGNNTLEEAVALIKRNSRRYAKRQLTWSRRDGFWKHFQPQELDLILAYLQQQIEAPFELSIPSGGASSAPTVLKYKAFAKNVPRQELEVFTAKSDRLLYVAKWPTTPTNQAHLLYLIHEVVCRHHPQPVYAMLPQGTPIHLAHLQASLTPLPEAFFKRHPHLATFPKKVLLLGLTVAKTTI